MYDSYDEVTRSSILWDDRVLTDIMERRAERKEEGVRKRMPDLLRVLAECRRRNDSLRCVLRFWIETLDGRVDRSVPRRLKLPHVLRQALGLAHQDVLLEPDDRLWALVHGGKTCLLYSP